jgi:hypothetical protein
MTDIHEVQWYCRGDHERYKIVNLDYEGTGKPLNVALGFMTRAEAIAWAKSKNLRLVHD